MGKSKGWKLEEEKMAIVTDESSSMESAREEEKVDQPGDNKMQGGALCKIGFIHQVWRCEG